MAFESRCFLVNVQQERVASLFQKVCETFMHAIGSNGLGLLISESAEWMLVSAFVYYSERGMLPASCGEGNQNL